MTRTFLQLCLDGYYDGMIFHRIVNNFLIQAGEVRRKDRDVVVKEADMEKYMSKYGYVYKAAQPDEAIPGSEDFMTRKKLELSPRIRFNHRGQLAMALPLDDEGVGEDSMSASLARQFFITMDEAPFLQSKYVIFGTVSGDTIFNAMRIGRTETVDEESGELADIDNAPMIKDVRIESHLFDDLVMTNEDKVPWKVSLGKNGKGGTMSEVKKRRKKRKGKKDLNVLSFGGEMEEGDGEAEETGGMLSSHDMLNGGANSTKSDKSMNKKKRKAAPDEGKKDKKDEKDNRDTKEDIQGTLKALPEHLEKKNIGKKEIKSNGVRDQAEKIKHDISEMTRVNSSSMKPQDRTDKRNPKEEKSGKKVSAIEARRLKYLKTKSNDSRKGSKQRDDNTMSKLSAFKSKMFEVKGVKKGSKKSKTKSEDDSLAARMVKQKKEEEGGGSFSLPTKKELLSVPVYSGQVLENDEFAENDGSWLKSRFKCRRHIDHDSKASAIGGDGRNMDDYEVIDEKIEDDNNNNRAKKRKRSHKRSDHRRK